MTFQSLNAPKRHTHDSASWFDAMRKLGAANGTICFVCAREPFPRFIQYKHLAVCGKCAPQAHLIEKMTMDELSEQEKTALSAGGDRAGDYLDSIKKTDLATLTKEQWDTFLEHVLVGYAEAMHLRAPF